MLLKNVAKWSLPFLAHLWAAGRAKKKKKKRLMKDDQLILKAC